MSGHGAEQYPFDPLLRPEQVSGLDRLRCIADRQYAATLYDIYLLAERNELEANKAGHRAAKSAARVNLIRSRLHELAHRALAGELGEEAQELARHLVTDGAGNVRADGRAMAELGRALAELGVV